MILRSTTLPCPDLNLRAAGGAPRCRLWLRPLQPWGSQDRHKGLFPLVNSGPGSLYRISAGVSELGAI